MRASICDCNLLHFADADIERVVQDVDQHVAAALEGGHDGVTPARCFSRSSGWRSSDAGLAAPQALALRARGDHVVQRLEPALGGRVDDLGIGEDVHQRLEVPVAGAGALISDV